MISISVVIATRNEEENIERCLRSFYHQSIPRNNYELLILDGQSTDKTVEIIERFHKEHPDLNIRVEENSRQVQSAAWNLGFKITNAEFVVLMGAHSEVDAKFLQKNLEMHRRFSPSATGGLVKAIGGSTIKSESIAAAFNSEFGSGNAKYWSGKEVSEVETVAFGMYRRADVLTVESLDENIIRGQDWEFNYRMTRKFGKMLFSPEIICHYYARTTFGKLCKRQFQAGYWKIYIFLKHPRSILIRHVIPLIFVISMVISVILTVSGIIWPLITLSLLYLLSSLISAARIYRDNRRANIQYLVLSFFCIQIPYGLGELFGILHIHRFTKLLKPRIDN